MFSIWHQPPTKILKTGIHSQLFFSQHSPHTQAFPIDENIPPVHPHHLIHSTPYQSHHLPSVLDKCSANLQRSQITAFTRAVPACSSQLAVFSASSLSFLQFVCFLWAKERPSKVNLTVSLNHLKPFVDKNRRCKLFHALLTLVSVSSFNNGLSTIILSHTRSFFTIILFSLLPSKEKVSISLNSQ